MKPMISVYKGRYWLEKYYFIPGTLHTASFPWWKNIANSEYAVSKNRNLGEMLKPWNGFDPNECEGMPTNQSHVEFMNEKDLTMFLLKWS